MSGISEVCQRAAHIDITVYFGGKPLTDEACKAIIEADAAKQSVLEEARLQQLRQDTANQKEIQKQIVQQQEADYAAQQQIDHDQMVAEFELWGAAFAFMAVVAYFVWRDLRSGRSRLSAGALYILGRAWKASKLSAKGLRSVAAKIDDSSKQ